MLSIQRLVGNVFRVQQLSRYNKLLVVNNWQQYRSFNTLQNKLEKRRQQQAQEEFKKELEYLVNKPEYTLVDYKQRIIDSLAKLQKGLKAKLFGGNQEQSEQQLTTQKKILNSLYDKELIDDKVLKGPQKKEISLVTQIPVEEINMLLLNFSHLVQLHTWLKTLRQKNIPLPETQEEMLYRFRTESKVKKSYYKFNFKQPIFNRNFMKKRIKWGPRKNL